MADKKFQDYPNQAVPEDGGKILYENAVGNNSYYQTYAQNKTEMQNKDLIKLNPALAAPVYEEGIIYYDQTDKCPSYYNDQSVVTHNLGRELWARSYNNTGVQINNGQVVYISGEASGSPEIELAQPDKFDQSRVIGVATQDIADGADGEVTKFGLVRGLDTSSLSTGVVYLDTDGSLTNTVPSGANFTIIIGIVLVSDVSNGILFVNPYASDLTVEITDSNGFSPAMRSATTMSFNDLTRIFTLAPTGSAFYYYINGKQQKVESSVTVEITDVEGLHVIYFDDDSGVLSSLVNPDRNQIDTLIRTKCLVSYIYWDATNSERNYFADERHGISMSPDTHSYLHFTRGAQYLSGLGLGDITADSTGNANADAQFSIESGFTTDEDLITTYSIIGSTAGLPIYYLDGSNADLRRITNSGFSVLDDITAGVGATGRLVYNEFTGTIWQLTTVSNNNFVLCHVFAINGYSGTDQQIAIIGQNDYATLTQARNGAQTEISSILSQIPFEEKVSIGTIIFQTSDVYANDVKARIRSDDEGNDYVDWRTTELAQGVTPTAHNNLTNLGWTISGHSTASSIFSDARLAGFDSDGNPKIYNYGVLPGVIEVTSTSYTASSANVGYLTDLNNASSITLILPEDATENLLVGTQLYFRQKGAGQVTFTTEGTDVLQSADSLNKIRTQYSQAIATKIESGVWQLDGDLTS